ncbi:STAS domain protein [Geotalea daltonii FRC-32]|uniref:STAS domain protein n=1 Tax=Geotalea daltonii (strain DSM 22248 / JCM 15807 / FRC-32) TaxID=316067 RepID=B9M9P0_GEODF|nr:STAS domain-containing protein [Geotalea daltonii]ACM20612.1 STAS domain protein [Geotalea daltonii FRC-32]
MGELKVTMAKAEGNPAALVVKVSGPLTVQNVGELKTSLLQALEGGEQLCLDLAGVTEVDLAGLQLLCSAHRSSLHLNKHLCITTGDSDIIDTASMEAGFQRHVGCAQDKEKSCFWVGGND